ncbi:MAG: SpoIIE family protein phosphatase [Cytophagales bacterium]|nr:SpoIIE family protein phosphatase [Cytophagales bacterium]
MKKNISILIFTLCLCNGAILVPLFHSGQAFAQKYNFRTYSLEEGLVQSQIPSICQDNDGNMWIGTFGGGVSKFNGQTFQTYNTTDGLINNDIRVTMLDSQGNIWFGTRQGVSKLIINNNEKCTNDSLKSSLCICNFSIKDGLAGNYIESIFEDSKGNIWFGTRENGLSKLSYIAEGQENKKKKAVFLNYSVNNGLPDSIVTDIKEDKYGNIWAATFSGLSKLPKGYEKKFIKSIDTIFENFKKEENLSYNYVHKLIIDREGNIWCGTMRGIRIYLPKTNNKSAIIPQDTTTYEIINFTDEDGLANSSIYAMMEDKAGNIWVGTDEDGLYKVTLDLEHRKLKILDYFTMHNGLSENQIWSLCEDREGNIWIGTNGGGVSRYSGKMFESFTTEDGLAHNVVWEILEDKKGNFWFRTHIGGISIYDPKAQTDNLTLQSRENKQIISYSTEEGLENDVVRSLMKDREGNIWVATLQSGVSKVTLNKKRGRLTSYNPFGKNDSLANRTVYAMLKDSKGNMWFSTFRGLFKYSNNNFTLVTKEDGLIEEQFTAMMEDSKGDIWCLTRSGVSKLTIEKNKKSPAKGGMKFTNYTTKEGLITDYMISALEDDKENIWLGGQGGVSVYDPQADKFHNFTSKEGLSSDMIYLINKDDNGYIWIGTNKGIDRVRYEDGKITVKNYGKLEGFIGIETNSEATYKDSEGNLWFGTIKGVTKYNPALDKENKIEPLTHITGLRLFFEDVDWSGFADSIYPKTGFPAGLQLPYDQNHLTFDFVGISLTIPEKVRYQWKLNGFDKKWSPITSKHEATYSNISHGKYTFLVKACNNDGVWNKQPATFSFEITPPFWLTWWFWLTCGLTGFGVVMSYIKIRERKLRIEKRILEEKVTERTKELSQANVVIAKKNKDITASINYAYRIQDAILPDTDHLQKFFPDSFVLYKIKDVVSGDFPWLLQKEDDVYVTAVDCTGHGVPGAMLSMIGHFLLTEIISSKNIQQPATILSHLHDGVNNTLNQDINLDSRDGMDIAFCKINTKKMELEYAGAHRPLLHLTNGDLNEIKGDRLPIGGTQYARKGREMKFTNHLIKIRKGDAIFFYSDGFTDQFGGPDEKKLMTTRVREVILNNKDKGMPEIGKVFEKTFDEWMGHNKQTDDAIFIGIRF